MLKYYLKELLNVMFIVTPLCAVVGIALASRYVRINLLDAFLLLLAMAFANMAVDTLNDYADFKKGIDFETVHTKFSGGPVTLLVSGKIKPKPTLAMALAVFSMALIIGAYFVIRVPLLAYIVVIGAVTILIYSKFLLYTRALAEPMLALIYMLVPLGSYIAMIGSASHLLSALFVSIPVGIIVALVLLINEVPDRNVDKKHGRKSIAVLVYDIKKISRIYLSFQIVSLLILLIGVLAGFVPFVALLAFLAIPFMLKAYSGFGKYKNPKQFEKYMGADVAYFLSFVILLSIGLFLHL
ncbi:MAG: prenyltransferase [Candidatus Micrarchaeia archaeon]